MTEKKVPSLPELRAMAHKAGYTIQYPGFYCDKATVVPTYKQAEGKPSISVSMVPILAGLRKLAAVVENLSKEGEA
jgi:hypothetical protein